LELKHTLAALEYIVYGLQQLTILCVQLRQLKPEGTQVHISAKWIITGRGHKTLAKPFRKI